jgi:hypothetical protein
MGCPVRVASGRRPRCRIQFGRPRSIHDRPAVSDHDRESGLELFRHRTRDGRLVPRLWDGCDLVWASLGSLGTPQSGHSRVDHIFAHGGRNRSRVRTHIATADQSSSRRCRRRVRPREPGRRRGSQQARQTRFCLRHLSDSEYRSLGSGRPRSRRRFPWSTIRRRSVGRPASHGSRACRCRSRSFRRPRSS